MDFVSVIQEIYISERMNFLVLFREFLLCVSSVIHSLTPVNSLCWVLGINPYPTNVENRVSS